MLTETHAVRMLVMAHIAARNNGEVFNKMMEHFIKKFQWCAIKVQIIIDFIAEAVAVDQLMKEIRAILNRA